MARIQIFVTGLLLVALSLAQASDGQIKWSIPFPGNIGSSVTYDQINNRLFVGSSDSSVYSLDALGNILWSFETGGYIAASPVLSEDGATLFVSSYDHHLYALNSENGKLLWAFDAGEKIYASPALDAQGQLYFGAKNGYFFCVSAESGLEQWHFNAGSAVGSSAAISHDGNVYFGTSAGNLYALSISAFEANPSATHSWVVSDIDYSGVASPIIGLDGSVFVGTAGNNLYSISSTGSILWSKDLGARITSAPVIDRTGTLYVSTFDNGALNAIDSSDGNTLWELPLSDIGKEMYSSPIIGDDLVVYVSDFDGYVFAIDSQRFNPSDLSEMFKWAIQLNSPVIASPLISDDGTLYIPSQDNSLFAIDVSSLGPLDSPWPMFGNNFSRTSHQSHIDSDNDGIPDLWEAEYGLSSNADDSAEDGDSDGLNNIDEYYSYTDPTNADSDSDGLPDGWEVDHGSNPRYSDAGHDADNDGTTNYAEYQNEQSPPESTFITELDDVTTGLLGGVIQLEEGEASLFGLLGGLSQEVDTYILSHNNGNTISWPSYEIRDQLPDLKPGEKLTVSVLARTEETQSGTKLALDVYSMDGSTLQKIGPHEDIAQTASMETYNWEYINKSGVTVSAPIIRFRFEESSDNDLKAYIESLSYQIEAVGLPYADLLAEIDAESPQIVQAGEGSNSYRISHDSSSLNVEFTLQNYLDPIQPGEILIVNTSGRTSANTDNKGTVFTVHGLGAQIIDSLYEMDGLNSEVYQSETDRHYSRVFQNTGTSPISPNLVYAFSNITDPSFSAVIKDISYRTIPESTTFEWIQNGTFRRDAWQLYDLASTSFSEQTRIMTNSDDAKVALSHDFTYAFWRSADAEVNSVSTYEIRNYIPNIAPGQSVSISFDGRTELNSDDVEATVSVLGELTNLTPSSSVLVQSAQESHYTLIYRNDTGIEVQSPVLQVSFDSVTDPDFEVFIGNIEYLVE